MSSFASSSLPGRQGVAHLPEPPSPSRHHHHRHHHRRNRHHHHRHHHHQRSMIGLCIFTPCQRNSSLKPLPLDYFALHTFPCQILTHWTKYRIIMFFSHLVFTPSPKLSRLAILVSDIYAVVQQNPLSPLCTHSSPFKIDQTQAFNSIEY